MTTMNELKTIDTNRLSDVSGGHCVCTCNHAVQGAAPQAQQQVQQVQQRVQPQAYQQPVYRAASTCGTPQTTNVRAQPQTIQYTQPNCQYRYFYTYACW